MELVRPSSGVTHPVYVSRLQPKADVHLDLEDLFCILQIEPNDTIIAMELARRLNALGRPQEAVRILRNVVDIDYRFETLGALGAAEYQAERIEDAFEHLQQAVMVAPGETPLLFEVFKTLGNIFVRRGDLDSAEDSYNKALRINPASDVLYVNFGTLAVQRQRWDEASDRFRHAITLNNKNDKAWVGLALSHRMKGDAPLAWGNLEAALEYNPLNDTALTLALDWGIQEGKEFRVLEFIRNFLVAGGWNEKFSLAFAWLSYRRGDHFKARLELERLLAVNPKNENALNLAREIK